ncbi:MAG: hypothetical protein WC764_04120 [Candidatus Paceibacterota bacterium]|jgi:hypothetical protein
MYENNKMSWWLYMAGLFVVVVTHVYMLVVGLPETQASAHAIVNIVAGCMLVAGWLTRKA